MSGTFPGLFRWVLGTWGKYPNIYYSNVIRSKVSGAPESFREGAAGGLLNVSGAPKSSREGAAEGLLKISRDWGGLGGFRVEIVEGLGRGLSSMSFFCGPWLASRLGFFFFRGPWLASMLGAFFILDAWIHCGPWSVRMAVRVALSTSNGPW